jgi:rod shape-determining protein MreC
MESFLNRYRNITVLLLVIFAQLVLLAAQVKNDQDVRVIRVWAVTTVTPVARIAEFFRGGSTGFFKRYILLRDAGEENRKLREEVGRLRIENTFLKNEINTADRAKALQIFQQHTQSKMLAATVVMTGVGLANSNTVYVDRGSNTGVMRGMGVVTPDGIVGKIVAVYPTASQVMLISDPDFAVGVISQKSQSHGILRGQGSDPLCKVDYVRFEDKIEKGEMFYTSGDDRIFPRGFAVGVVKDAKDGTPFKEVLVEPTGIQHGVEDVLIIMESVHQTIPDAPPANQPMYISPAPPAAVVPEGQTAPAAGDATTISSGTEADKLRSIYKAAGDAQNHVFGTGLPGSKPPDFKNLPATPGGAPVKSAAPVKPPAAGAPAPAAGADPGTRLQRQTGVPTAETPAKSAPPKAPAKTSNTAAPSSETPAKSAPPKSAADPAKAPAKTSNIAAPTSETPAKTAPPKSVADPAKTPAKTPAAPPKGPGGQPLE